MIPTNPSESTRRRYVRNIVKVFRQASDDQYRRGMDWYVTAHDVADMMSEGDIVKGAGVIAALSAQKSWRENQRLASDAFAGEIHGHVANQLAQAAKIMAGADPSTVLPMDAKTGNFYRCILDPEDAEAVCVDRHAHDIAVGSAWGQRERGLSSKGRYAALSLAYRNAAVILGVLPSQVQAVTWVVWTESLAGIGTRGRQYASAHD